MLRLDWREEGDQYWAAYFKQYKLVVARNLAKPEYYILDMYTGNDIFNRPVDVAVSWAPHAERLENELKHRLHMAAESLDSSWLEVETGASGQLFGIPSWDGIRRSRNHFTGQLLESCSVCRRVDGDHASDCPVLHTALTVQQNRLDPALCAPAENEEDKKLLQTGDWDEGADPELSEPLEEGPQETSFQRYLRRSRELMAQAIGYQEFCVLNGRPPTPEEQEKATAWAKLPHPPVEYDEDEEEESGYDQILDMIRAESRTVKL